MADEHSEDENTSQPTSWIPGMEIAFGAVLGGAASEMGAEAIKWITSKPEHPFVTRVLALECLDPQQARYSWTIELVNQTTSGAAIVGASIGKKGPVAINQMSQASMERRESTGYPVRYPFHLDPLSQTQLRAFARINPANSYVELNLDIRAYNAAKNLQHQTILACLQSPE
ncbi:hypothetical protein [uncultured Erythrobacter sp.]|uniref:hypothetical protein n=1 Tax=uncultured Erythrobacter sp. TaxID=263913 RepID=UPI002623A99D|nr:hypothetical protein [uncultured Erythrobacter sp.]